MNAYTISFLLVLAGLVFVFIYEKVTGRAVFHIEVGATILQAVTTIAKVISASTDNEYFDMVATVMQAATDATTRAETLWMNGDIPKDQRKDYAYLFITESLKEAGVEVTEQVEDIITGTIAIVAALLPHGLTPKVPAYEVTTDVE